MTLETNCQRSSTRKRVLMTATIIGADGTQPARVNELTSSGTRIACDRPLAPGSDVIFKRGRISIAARVAWSKDESAGLEFYRDLPGLKIAA